MPRTRSGGWPGSGCSLDKAPLTHPAYLYGLALLDDHSHRTVAAGELEHPGIGFAILLHVMFHEIYPPPLQILTGSRAVRATRRSVEFHRFSHAGLLLNLDRFSIFSQSTLSRYSHRSMHNTQKAHPEALLQLIFTKSLQQISQNRPYPCLQPAGGMVFLSCYISSKGKEI